MEKSRTINTRKRDASCVILANGEFPTHETALTALRTADFICCCDGAVEQLVGAGVTPDIIIGDGDSIPATMRERFARIFIQIDEQDYNDLTKATRYCAAKGFRRIKYLGATGKREDHTIGNIFLLPYYLRELGVEPTMITDEGEFRPYLRSCAVKTYAGQQVSIFNISCSALSGEGLRYPLSPFAELWQGTLNEAIAEEIKITGDGIWLLFLKF